MSQSEPLSLPPEFIPAVELPSFLWLRIFSFLDIDTLRQACAVCRHWSVLGADDWLWKHYAQARWPARTLRLDAYDGSFRRMVLHNNTRNAVPGFDLGTADCSCYWRYNDPTEAYYRCRLLHLELQPLASGAGPAFLRLYFDARGESDLRGPRLSTLAVVRRDELPPPPPERPRQDLSRERLLPPHPRHQMSLQRMLTVAQAPTYVWPTAPASLQCDRVSSLSGPLLSAVVAAELPSACVLVSEWMGHFKGCLEWSGPPLHRLLRSLGQQDGLLLIFVYANDIRGLPQENVSYWRTPDYAPALVLGPSIRDFRAQWRSLASYNAPGELLERMSRETEEDERARWADLPPEVASRRRGSWWASAPAPAGAPRPVGAAFSWRYYEDYGSQRVP